MKHLLYLRYIVRHKWYVFVECCRLGIVWRGITHDLSKFLPSEWFPYVEYFYGGGKNNRAFNVAWLKHIHRNPHHWQYWILREDDGGTEPLDMPEVYRCEMLADWIGAGKAITGTDNLTDWYLENKDKMMLGSCTRLWVIARLVERNPHWQIAEKYKDTPCQDGREMV